MPTHNPFYMTSPFKGPERFPSRPEFRPGEFLTSDVGLYNPPGMSDEATKHRGRTSACFRSNGHQTPAQVAVKSKRETKKTRAGGCLTSNVELYCPPGMGDEARKHRGKASASFLATNRESAYPLPRCDAPLYVPPGFADEILQRHVAEGNKPSAVFRSSAPRMPVPYKPSAASHLAPYQRPTVPKPPQRPSAVFASRTGRMFEKHRGQTSACFHSDGHQTSPQVAVKSKRETKKTRAGGCLTSNVELYCPPGMGDEARKHRGKASASFLATNRESAYPLPRCDAPVYVPPGFADEILQRHVAEGNKPSAVFRSSAPRMPVPYKPSAASHLAPYQRPTVPKPPQRPSAVFASRTGRMFEKHPAHTNSHAVHRMASAQPQLSDRPSTAQTLTSEFDSISQCTNARLSHVPRVRGYAFGLSPSRCSQRSQSSTADVDYRLLKTFVDEILER